MAINLHDFHMNVLADQTNEQNNEQTNDRTNVSIISIFDEISPMIKPKQYYNYITLDSDNCYFINEARDKFNWVINEEKIILKPGIINLHSSFRNIIAARIGRITLNHMTVAFATSMVNRNRVSLGFEEFASQALITPDNNRFQFLAYLRESDKNYGTNITLSPFDCNRGWFRFREPFTTLSSLTLNMYNMITGTKISLPDSYVSFSAIKHSGNMVFSEGAEIYEHTITITNGSYLPINYIYRIDGNIDTVPASVVGEQVVFSDIDTGDPLLDALYNGLTKTITLVRNNEFIVNGEVGQIFPPGNYPMTITLIYKPRLLCTLELVSEYD